MDDSAFALTFRLFIYQGIGDIMLVTDVKELPMKKIIVLAQSSYLLVLLVNGVFLQSIHAQVWKYDFGAGSATDTSTIASTTFLPSPPGGTARVRVGAGSTPGAIVLANPGLTALGSDAELQITTSLGSSSPTKFSVHDYASGNTGYIKFRIAFGRGANGVYSLSLGDGSSFSDNTSVNTNEVFAGIRWSFGSLHTISYQVLDNNSYVNTTISHPSDLFVQDTIAGTYQVELYLNNSANPKTYIRTGQQYNLANDTWDLWVNHTRVGTSLPSGALADHANIDSYVFSHQANITSPPGTIFIDDIEYSNSLPQTVLAVSAVSIPDFGTVSVGAGSAYSSFTIQGANLMDDILVLAPPHYGISTDTLSFADSIILSVTGGVLQVQPVTVYVRFLPAITGILPDSILVSSSGASLHKISVSGQGISSNAGLSDIIADPGFSYPQHIDYTNYQANDLTFAHSIEVAQFTIRDGGGSLPDVDTAGTTLVKLKLVVGNMDQLRRIGLYVDNDEVGEVGAAGIVSFNGLQIRADDGGTKMFSLRVSFRSAVTDNAQFLFTMSSVVTTASGSHMMRTDAGAATTSVWGDDNSIQVVADRLLFDEQPVHTNINMPMGSSVVVSASDTNGNRDVDFTGQISVTSSGTLTASPNIITAVSGVAVFTSLIHMATGSGLILTAASGVLSSAGSDTFTIADPLKTILMFPSTWTGAPSSAAPVYQDEGLNGTGMLTRGPDLTIASSTTRFNASGWSTSPTLLLSSNGAYLTFTLVASDGYELNLNNALLNLTLGSSAVTGPTSFGIYTSVAGFSSVGNQVGATLTPAGTSVTFPSSGYDRLPAIEIRIYGWNASSSLGTGGLASLSLLARNSPIQYVFNGAWSPSSPVGMIRSVNNLVVLSGSPVLSGDVSCSHLSIRTGSVLSLGAGKKLIMNGVISGNGSIGGSPSSQVVVNGSGAFGVLHIDQTSASTRSLSSLVINRLNSTVYLGDSLEIYDSVSLNNGLLVTGGKLKLKATSGNTGVISAITGTGMLSGMVTAEYYIPGIARRWRFIASPFSNARFEDLRQEIYITGAGMGNKVGTLNSNGFDATSSNQPSVYSYNESIPGNLNSGWEALFNTTSSLNDQLIVPGKGYRVFIRGDRSDTGRLNGMVSSQNTVTMNLSGLINTGSITLPVTYTGGSGQANDGWNLVGNPYPCAYNWKTFMDAGTHAAHIDSTIYILDATSGSYKSYNAFSGAGTLTNGIIPMGASFWVKANAASPSLVLTEQFKMTTRPAGLFKMGIADELSMTLELDSVTNDLFVLKHHSNSTVNRDVYDIVKLTGEVNIMSTGNDGVPLAYDMRPLCLQNDTVQLFVSGGNHQYTLKVGSVPVNENVYYYLVDKMLNTVLFLSPGFMYRYTTSVADSSSYGKRFQIITSKNALLPVKYEHFIAVRQGESVLLEWTAASGGDGSCFIAERSVNDLSDWQQVGEVKTGNGYQHQYYCIVDKHPLPGKNYYRIREVDAYLMASYSPVRIVSFNEEKMMPLDLLMPNPAKDRVSIRTGYPVKKVELYDLKGVLLLTSYQPELIVESLSPGIYIVEITNMDDKMIRSKLIKN